MKKYKMKMGKPNFKDLDKLMKEAMSDGVEQEHKKVKWKKISRTPTWINSS